MIVYVRLFNRFLADKMKYPIPLHIDTNAINPNDNKVQRPCAAVCVEQERTYRTKYSFDESP